MAPNGNDGKGKTRAQISRAFYSIFQAEINESSAIRVQKCNIKTFMEWNGCACVLHGISADLFRYIGAVCGALGDCSSETWKITMNRSAERDEQRERERGGERGWCRKTPTSLPMHILMMSQNSVKKHSSVHHWWWGAINSCCSFWKYQCSCYRNYRNVCSVPFCRPRQLFARARMAWWL